MYFAYGSNMASSRLRSLARAPGARLLGVARLGSYALRLHKRGDDGSGKCSVVSTGSAADCVHGVLFSITTEDEKRLDRVEGLGIGYDKAEVALEAASGKLRAMTYVARPSHIDPEAVPFDWYMTLVIAGAREHGLPADYIRRLESFPVKVDTDVQRSAAALAILAQG